MLQEQKIAWDEVLAWHAAAVQTEAIVVEEAERRAKEAVLGLHDVKTAVSLVTRNAEAIIGELPGWTDEEKLEGASNALKSLLKSVQLLHTRLSMSSIVTNPESASHGQRRLLPVYKVFHRMVRLFEQLAAKRHVSVRMTGSSYQQPACYDSFETLALILIDNAIKYSLPGQEVTVTVDDTLARTVQVSVESFGPVVPVELQANIFARGVRAPNAARFTSAGSGLGLHIAQIVADAHGFSIHYTGEPRPDQNNMGRNTFFFEVSV